MLYGFLVTFFVIICVLMVVVILLQASKGGGLAGSFGGMGNTGGVLGGRGATTFLQKLTIGLGLTYGVLCLIISLTGYDGSDLPASKTQELIRQTQPANLPGVEPSGNLPTELPADDGSATQGTPEDGGSSDDTNN